MGFLQNLMQAPAPGSRGAAFGAAMGNMAPLLFAMAKGLGEGKSASTYAPSGLAAMMLQQQTEADRKMRQEDRDYSRSQDARMWDWRESGRAREDAALAEENRLRRDANSGLAQLLGGGASQYGAMAATGGPTNAAARMSALAPQIEETAAALGMSPVDLATIISYETGGTFDPAQAGPTTQWGQHRGLIQFGEPQARQYGVDWNDPVNSQLGADGAVARYFRENGWQPGMGMKDAYSIVNAGAPGRYSAKDEHVGGAPGTVAEKVDTQMAGHRRRAEAMFPQQQARISPQRAAEILSNPYATDAAKQMVLAQFMPQEEDRTTLRQNVEWLMAQGMPFDQALQSAKGGQTINVGPGGPNMGAIPAGHVVVEDANAPGGYRTVPMQGTEAAREAELAETKAARREDTQETSGDVVLNAGLRALKASKDRFATGALGSLAAFNPGSDNAEVYRQVAVLRATARIETLNEMKQNSPTGSALGAVSDSEGIVLEAKAGALDPASPNFERDLGDYMRTLLRTIHGKKAGDAMFEQSWTGADIKGVEANRGYGRGGAQASPAPSQPGIVGMDGQPVSDEAVRLLKENPTPEYRAFFDEVFGKGVAEQVLGQ